MHLTLLAGLMAVVCVLAPLSGIPSVGIMLNTFSTAPLFLIGFSLGMPNVLLAVCVATPLLLIAAGLTATATFLALQIAPLLLITHLALQKTKGEWRPPLYILGALTALALAAVTLFFLWIGFVKYQTLHEFMTEWIQNIFKTNELMALDASHQNTLQKIYRYFPAFFGMSWIFILSLNALLCLQILQTKKHALRPYPVKTDFKTIQGWDIPFFVGVLGTLTPYPLVSAWGYNVMLLSAIPLFFVGLRLFYLRFMQLSVAKVWFFVMLCFMLVLAWPMLFVVALGVVEPLLQLRQRIKK